MLLAGVPVGMVTAAPAERRPARSAEAASPEAAVELLAAAARANDMDAIVAQLGGPLRAEWEYSRAAEALDAAIAGQFGAGGLSPPGWPALRDGLARFKGAVRVRGRAARADGAVDLTVWVTVSEPRWGERIYEETWTGRKAAAGWKLSFSHGGERRSAAR